MKFAQRRNRLTTHFSEGIPSVERRISVLIHANYRLVNSVDFSEMKLGNEFICEVANCINTKHTYCQEITINKDYGQFLTRYRKDNIPSRNFKLSLWSGSKLKSVSLPVHLVPSRSALLWVITKRILVIPDRRFGINYRFYLQRSRYFFGLRNSPEERCSHLNHGGILK
jgi:hypothetical protein